MGLVDFVIDVSAVIKASRSVASKHVALRGRQLNAAYGRSSRAAAGPADRAPGTAEPSRDDVVTGGDEVRERREAGGGGGEECSGSVAMGSDTITTTTTTTTTTPPPEATSTAAAAAAAEGGLRPDDRLTPGPRPSANEIFAASVAPGKEDGGRLDMPAGIDVNIFHTSNGSKILKSLREERRSQERAQAVDGGSLRPAKEHPMRYWPRPPPVQVDEPVVPHEVPLEPTLEKVMSEDIQEQQRDEQHTQEQKEQEQQVEDGSSQAGASVSRSEEPAAEATPSKILARAEAESKQPQSTSDGPPGSTPPTPLSSSAHVHQLRESKVPATRFSRLMNYGGLAAGLLGGAMTESFSRALGGGGQGSVLLSPANTERLVAKLSKMRGAALKIGQMMSFQDSKMLPGPIQEVLQRVQDRADYMPAWQRDRVLAANLGPDWREALFAEFEETPIAAASIGQVHRAVLRSSGKRVAVKIQFPGVADSIHSDLDNIGMLLTATRLLPRGLYLDKTIDNARLELGWECDYERELRCAQRYRELLRGTDDEAIFTVPDVYPEASGKQVLTMDFLDGIGVTRVRSFTQPQRDWIGTQLLRLCLREITRFRFMQTDPNWTNFLYNAATNRLELLDFGASREFPDAFVRPYVRLLEAAARSDRPAIERFSRELGYLTGHESRIMLDAHVRSIQTLAEPFLASAPEVYDFKDQTITERVKALIPVMLHERLTPPPEETYSLHRKMSGAFLLCARLESRVPCRQLFVESVGSSGFLDADESEQSPDAPHSQSHS